MWTLGRGLLVVALAVQTSGLGGQHDAARRLRVGVYDNRAIAVAYAASDWNQVRTRTDEHARAKEAGDEARVQELGRWGKAHQRQLHRQGFARVPVDDLLEHVRDRLPEVARDQGLDLIAWHCDYVTESVEVIDVTHQLVLLFEPSEKTLRTIAELVQKDPVPLDELAGHDH